MKKRIFSLLLCVAMICSLILPTYALENQTAERSYIGTITAEDIQRSNDKFALVQTLYDMLYENPSSYSKSQISSAVSEYKSKYAKDLTASVDELIATTSTKNARGTGPVTLGYTCYTQQTGYYCGPASAQILIRGAGKSSTVTQSTLASQLGTTTSGTNFSSAWTTTLNSYWGYSLFALKWGTASGWADSYRNCMIIDVNIGKHGAINNIYCNTDNVNLPGWTSSLIAHYVTVDGFNTTNETVHYLDPSDGAVGRLGGHWVTFSQMSTATQQRGIIF